jgi:acyl-[acyl-carrier-protein] desaturase
MAYVAFQELATRISHRNTGRYSQDPVADRIMARIAADENLHMVFYRDLVDAAFEVAPSATLHAVADEIVGFEMPGAVMGGFTRMAARIADAGIYDLRSHHDDVVQPLLRRWRIWDRTGMDEAAERRREQLADELAALDAAATHFEERRTARRARRERRAARG